MVKKNKLAILGGDSLIRSPFDRYNSLGKEEMKAVEKVMKSGELSKFLGTWHEDFYGGENIKKLEKLVGDMFEVKYVISVNSWTSGLVSAIGSLDIEPGDEIIVSPWTMSASAMAILHWNAIPVFADIDHKTFNINPYEIEKKISKRTKAIMSVDIFGQSSDIDKINKLAKKYNLKVISDTAQSPYAKYKDRFAGTLSDIGGFSLNYHKHINCGEGGILVTNNEELAERMQLIRNHAESVVAGKGVKNINNMIGHNFRMGELESVIAFNQFKKLPKITKKRTSLGMRLIQKLSGLEGLITPHISENSNHVFYVFPLLIDEKKLGLSREIVIKSLEAEGVPGLMNGYQNLHLLPMFQKKIAYGKKNFPWSLNDNSIDYKKGICPVAESYHENSFIGINFCMFDFNKNSIDLISNAFHKVWDQRDSLIKLSK